MQKLFLYKNNNLKYIEESERRYFDTIKTQILCSLNKVLNDLESRIKIIDDWKEIFLKTSRQGYKQSDLDKGSERVFHNWAADLFKLPNSTPVGSDLVFDSDEGFRIHIDIKTALIDNPSDYKGKINIGKNQTSYKSKNFKGDLPECYSDEKITLTYAIQIIHEHFDKKIYAIILACIPNGFLNSIYGDKIIKAGKGGYKKARDFRFNYNQNGECLKFKLIKNKPPRVEIICALENLDIHKTFGCKLKCNQRVKLNENE